MRVADCFSLLAKTLKLTIETFVIVDSLNILEDILLELSEAEIYDINNIVFSLHQIDNYEKQVREMAIENAKERAKEIASGFGVKIKKVLYIEESAFGKNYPNPFNPSMTNDSILQEISTAGLHSKPIKLTNQIKVVFEIE